MTSALASPARRSTASKLGTRVVAGAIVTVSVVALVARGAPRASGAARASTIAGTGAPGFNGDGRAASEATLASPGGVAVDAAGDVFIADTGHCRVREVPVTNTTQFGIAMRARTIHSIAGSTKCGARGDRGPATRAQLSSPSDVAVDAKGNVLVADTGNNRIRRIVAADTKSFLGRAPLRAGAVITFAGTGHPGYSGDGGFAPAARLDGPSGVAVDPAGNVLIADTNNCRVREVAAADGTHFGIAMKAGSIYTVAGSGSCGKAGDNGPARRAQLWTPSDVAVDAQGNLLIADTGNRRVREVAAVAGTFFGIAMAPGNIYTVAGSGTYNAYFGDGLPAASDASSLSFPTGVAVDAAGNLLVSDTYGRAVREVAATSGASFGIATQPGGMYTLAGAGPAGSSTAGGTRDERVVYPARLAVDGRGNVLVADLGNNTVAVLSGTG